MATRPLTPAEYDLPVRLIRITIHTTGKFFESDTRSGNHASIFLVIGVNRSVRINMTKAGPTDTMGTYTVTWCDYDVSNSSVRDIDITPVQGLTVRHITHLITRNGRDKYMLAPSGVGCRYWV
ncbi:hypothetical protein TMatcc_002527 [Talaromyces marneffei ATCC 18224]